MNLKSRYEEIEDVASYANTLSEDDKDWLNRFSQEYICGNFTHGGEQLHEPLDNAGMVKTVIKEIMLEINNTKDKPKLRELWTTYHELRDYFYETANQVLGAYNRNNVRNRCQMTRKKASGEIDSLAVLRNKEIAAPDDSNEND